jgi:hypothetical protein
MYKYIPYIVALLFAAIMTTGNSYAAFPIGAENAAEAPITESTRKRSFDKLIDQAIEKYNLPTPKPFGEAAETPVFGILAFVLGLAGLAAFVGAFALASPILLVGTLLCGIGAIVLGILGRKKPLKGFAIAGFALGIVDLVLLLIVAIILFIIALILGEEFDWDDFVL